MPIPFSKRSDVDEGDIIELYKPPLSTPNSNKWAEIGCKAEVVNGMIMFPYLYNRLQQKVAPQDIDNFIWVVWDYGDPKFHGIDDGAYLFTRFGPVTTGAVFNITSIGLSSNPWNNNPTPVIPGLSCIDDDEDIAIEFSGEVTEDLSPAPTNNDGRYPGRCWWCKSPLKQIPGAGVSFYDVCTNPKCGR